MVVSDGNSLVKCKEQKPAITDIHLGSTMFWLFLTVVLYFVVNGGACISGDIHVNQSSKTGG